MTEFYKIDRDERNLPAIEVQIVHTDRCGPQYLCRQNFFKIATSKERNALVTIHKFAVKFCFKGSWDATGKHVKGAILKCELKHD